MAMKSKKTNIDGALLIQPDVFRDARGFFFESWREMNYESLGISGPFVQDNFSSSRKNVLRGLHYQLGPAAQGKLVCVLSGAVFDVLVDLRVGSPTFGKWEGHTLLATTHEQLWIPPGCAHGFLSLSDDTIFFYKCTHAYDPSSECILRWNDLELSIQWPLSADTEPIVSPRDQAGLPFADCVKFI
jgi:dTDP-4-dehydrorhamnose 3,5-epimerase